MTYSENMSQLVQHSVEKPRVRFKGYVLKENNVPRTMLQYMDM